MQSGRGNRTATVISVDVRNHDIGVIRHVGDIDRLRGRPDRGWRRHYGRINRDIIGNRRRSNRRKLLGIRHTGRSASLGGR